MRSKLAHKCLIVLSLLSWLLQQEYEQTGKGEVKAPLYLRELSNLPAGRSGVGVVKGINLLARLCKIRCNGNTNGIGAKG